MPKAELDSHDRRPLHERIAADLRDEIMSGDLQPGANLPSTQQLRDRFEVANATVQKALQVLKDERLAVGRPGSAVTVRPHRQETIRPADTGRPAPPGEQYSWLTAATSKGRRGSIELLEVAEVRPPVDVAAALRLDKNGMAVLRRQVLSYDGSPVELVKSYYPVELARGTAMAERRKIRGGTPALLAEMGYPPRHTVDRVSARVPTQEQFEALRLPSDLPVLRTFRVVYSDDERPIEVTVMAKAGHLYELQYEF
ncbi:GntR family transcriptional regulator [Streptomyces acidiscabies]|uniref:GntR family transcriptional regulator n=1 Tax=Streptomyces acidiscabies TaxID=42234 RepID=A0AAP6BIJ7_9ACTN|nr:GntR family transcriptional regulator [Streptomyces acidiscabies]MBP5939050.1 GntR family transcriptional regulator [Streptomyces sp. LBUM 1476]MBZ3910163.1 GntR family transcriptional regulator [Streptomyces acidiscabies]MDX2965400.1 GntR family transcriptional regulator [Streptomyces acidiscabies]MDX3023664.1 GntR family transcriptional regulator [Streptomyces acidiscabies]MDX3789742.1 GntR family transcriptional regulator [Streptomyces acidiscabies]